MRVCVWRPAVLVAVLAGVLVVGAVPAAAAVTGAHPAAFVVVNGSIFGKIAGALLGAFSWTTGVAAKFILVTLAAFIRMLIPASWAHVPVAVFDWIVAVPNYAGSITSPTGQTSYGFAGVNAIREIFQWIGIALIPITLTWSTSRAMLGVGEPAAAPLVRLLGMAGVLVFYPWLWEQAAAVVDQITHLILSIGQVTDGIRQLMAYATEGVALGGWQLIDLGLIGAVASELLALVFVKVIVVLVGAILYAVGPLMIGVVATEGGATVTRAWAAAAITWLAVPVAWSVIFAVGAVLIGDASTAGVLVGGSSAIEQILGGVIVAVAGVATLWLCLRASREASTVARGQLATITPALGHMRSNSGTGARPRMGASSRGGSPPAAQSLRSFQTRVAGSAGAALTAAGPRGAHAATVGGHAAQLGRRGLIRGGARIAGSAVRAHHTPSSAGTGPVTPPAGNPGTGQASPSSLTRVARARATASRMIAGGRAGWRSPTPAARVRSGVDRPTRRAPRASNARPTERSPRPTQAARPSGQPRPKSSPTASTPTGSPATRSSAARTSPTAGPRGGDATSSRPGAMTRSQPAAASTAPRPSPATGGSPRTRDLRPSGPAPQPARRPPGRGRNSTSTAPATPGRADPAPRPGPASDAPPSPRRDGGSEGDR